MSVEELRGALASAETEASYWKMKYEGEWPGQREKIAEEERERCARIVEEVVAPETDGSKWPGGSVEIAMVGEEIACRIREVGKEHPPA